jgi:hypothetical protein
MKNQAPFPELSLSELSDILSLTIKHDNACKLITFLAMLSAYTHQDQLNVTFNAPSSSGKTYITSEVAKLFPDEDKIEISGASPTALFYQKGIIDDESGNRIIDLERKILIFYELANMDVLKRLRPILSHDKRFSIHYYTNKSPRGTNRTDKIIIAGFPAAIFCSASMRLDEQEATRSILLSPQPSQEKLKAAIELQHLRGTDELSFAECIEANPKRQKLTERIQAIRDVKVDHIKLPDTQAIIDRFVNTYPSLKDRHTRDFTHIQQLIKAIALLNIWQRQLDDGSCQANEEDISAALALWDEVAESQDFGLPPAVLNFYHEYIAPLYKELNANAKGDMKFGISNDKLATYHLQKSGRLLNEDLFRKQILPQLVASGLVVHEKPSFGDMRYKLIYPVLLSEN